MKTILFLVIIILIIIAFIYGFSYIYFGGFLIGYQNNHLIMYKYTCADICPQYGSWSKKFVGKISEAECLKIGGSPEYITYAGVVDHGYNGCSPK
ncbi:MAG: hypothetical protein A2402_01935 [Candidatus Staskawiczbacteria bacterium RIFOXYC1_FULL_37_43]|uniref:Uncharacterized protein n=1 Tax=Candidatus Nomurabacteria bacterium RIFOXYA1_FULL_35_17 TaxID=1801798 RepID=A0A1F6YHP5_9BACT|nr:MAG: hypothetical protein A2192_01420 [Candidatus Nomurabacteria bacterium RIFOXYA1_FULL_35_17]OGZ63527.1 MAG: hypothetical protein A2813_00290 [Candidatus Staskawiczbacteria bacterium RIFCSPHIGHO2_01_FULL_37_17]OGZ71387.1 MAG: hypothetical protein A2891_02275 [Candidatus Staskawiczbacteria bacterium RIFCSPLOWO2_01_FULL_37_19]OGZ77732.1 MAG: hypothetical protein A2280_00820 [Candidatus Staskawiczbacteria bacterium RIFOXYA12_FULL_37_10]OGZ80780.1 MAG: hypothetical protein A2353_00885 [Candida